MRATMRATITLAIFLVLALLQPCRGHEPQLEGRGEGEQAYQRRFGAVLLSETDAKVRHLLRTSDASGGPWNSEAFHQHRGELARERRALVVRCCGRNSCFGKGGRRHKGTTPSKKRTTVRATRTTVQVGGQAIASVLGNGISIVCPRCPAGWENSLDTGLGTGTIPVTCPGCAPGWLELVNGGQSTMGPDTTLAPDTAEPSSATDTAGPSSATDTLQPGTTSAPSVAITTLAPITAPSVAITTIAPTTTVVVTLPVTTLAPTTLPVTTLAPLTVALTTTTAPTTTAPLTTVPVTTPPLTTAPATTAPAILTTPLSLPAGMTLPAGFDINSLGGLFG